MDASDGRQTYKGNCHCGANRYEIRLPDNPIISTCDCRLCTKKGYLWSYDAVGSLKVVRGGTSATLTTYKTSNDQDLEHHFCSICGTGMTGTHFAGPIAGKPGYNVRTLLEPHPIGELQLPGYKPTHGLKSGLEDASTISERTTISTEDHLKLYTGSCDCGAVKLALKSQPLSEAEIKEDNCSTCVRKGYVGVYPHNSQVSISGRENTTEYSWGRKFSSDSFCKTCGVHCFSDLHGPPKEIIDRLPEAKKEFVRKQGEIQPINVRILDEVEWDELVIAFSDEGTEGYTLSD